MGVVSDKHRPADIVYIVILYITGLDIGPGVKPEDGVLSNGQLISLD